MQRTIIPVFVSICFSIIWWSCAGQVPPEGGPKDLEPPEIVGVYPEPNSTNVDTDVIRFQFSKFVDRRSFEQSLFISPIIDDMEVNWRRRNVEIQIYESLRENTTYSITIGTDLRDTREGTRLNEAFTLAFSTGDEIDRGQVDGRVYYDDPVGVLIFAYQLRDSVMADTLNPEVQQPDYITQSGTGGSFRLPYLRFGTYRIVALRDEFQNRLYDPGVDPYGVYVGDITLTEEEPIARDVTIRMHKPDLTRPFISRVTALNNQKVSIRFNKPVDPISLNLDSFSITHIETQDPLEVFNYSIRKENPSEIYLFTAQQDDGEYQLTVDSTITDLYGNTLQSDDLDEIFTGTTEGPDKPVVVDYISPRPNMRNVHPLELITLQFSYPVKSERTENAISIVDTNEVTLTGEFIWDDDATVTYIPSLLMESKMPYTVIVELDSLPEANGMGYEDSLFTSKFTVMDRDMLGGIEGEVLTNREIPFTIKADKVGRRENGARYSITRFGGGAFSLRHIPEGLYTLWVFNDPGETGSYDFGEVVPFRGSAPFVTYPDTVRVRARWTVDGVVLDMRRYDEGGIFDAAERPE